VTNGQKTYLRLLPERNCGRYCAHPPAGEAEFLLRLVPPLAVTPEAIEVLVAANSAAVRAVVPVRAAPAMADT
jgi:hypothetical protein